MDAIDEYESVVMWFASQLFKTEIGLNFIGRAIHRDPGPALAVFPTASGKQSDAEVWAKQRLAPMIRDTPVLQSILGKDAVASKKATDCVLMKTYPGGSLTCVGSHVPGPLAAKPIRYLLLEEYERHAVSAGKEGDPVKLAIKRTANFWNRKIVKSSSGTIKGKSRVERDWRVSVRHKYYVKCHDCGEAQQILWSQVKWDKDPDTGKGISQTARYECEHCGAHWNDVQRFRAISKGEWIAENPGEYKQAAFWLWRGYSTFSKLSDIVQEWFDVLDSNDPEQLKVFVNTVLAELWVEEKGEKLEPEGLMTRRTNYGTAPIPKEVGLITAGCDVQAYRIEVEVLGWGVQERTWSLDYWILYGDTKKPKVWKELDEKLKTLYLHPNGQMLPIKSIAIDSGYATDEVYAFCRTRAKRGIFPIKGVAEAERKRITPPQKESRAKYPLWTLGVDQIKEKFFGYVKAENPLAFGYCSWPMRYKEKYFKGLTKETREEKKVRNKWTFTYVCPPGGGNEPADCRTYAMGARYHFRYNVRYNKELSTEKLDLYIKQVTSGVAKQAPQQRARGRRVRSKGVI